MRIVVLDGYTLNPGDLDWSSLHALGPCEVFDRTRREELPARAHAAEIILTNKTVLSAEHISALPALRYIGVLATGTNVVDLAAARARNIPVTNVPAYGTRSVAQATFALLLELTNQAGHHAQTVRAGRWANNLDWCYWDSPLLELDGLTLGIVGYGRIGRAVADLARAFGMKTLVHSRIPVADAAVGNVSLNELLANSDVVSLHCPLTPETKHLINGKTLALMKPAALLLNTSRGPLVDEAALASALSNGTIAGAALDVLSVEPPPAENPLLHARNCIITPHNAWATRAARSRLLQIAVDNVKSFLANSPKNVVN